MKIQKDMPNEVNNQALLRGNKETSSGRLTDLNRSLQVEAEAGDGVSTEVLDLNPDDHDELLDYEDDLSLDGEGDAEMVADINNTTEEDVVVSTSTSLKPLNNRPGEDVIQQIAGQPEEKLLNNLVIQNMMEKFFQSRFKDMMEQTGNIGKVVEKQLNNNQGSVDKQFVSLQNNTGVSDGIIKLPLDITVYAPLLQKKLTPQDGNRVINQATIDAEMIHPMPMPNTNHRVFDKNDEGQIRVVDNEDLIANFVESVRLERHPTENAGGGGNTNNTNNPIELEQQEQQQQEERRFDSNVTNGLIDAQRKADKAIIDAEKFRATIEPPGIYTAGDFQNRLGESRNEFSLMNIGSAVSDDDFFHLTCHIDPSLIHKIEKGEFVELEKLLPKEKLGKSSEENRLEWVQRDGGTFLVPAQKDNKISSFRRWEQAFRAYATMYCGANPHRSKEIWQYITVINTAASSYLWENVYNYDVTFRHLMAFNPQRSWAVTYNQMWNLSMRDPLPRNSYKGNYTAHYSGSSYVSTKKDGNQFQVKRNKSDYCWNFNKGVPCKFGSKCKFIERCKYCDSPSHGVNACTKLQKKEASRGATATGQTSTSTQANK